MKNCYLRNVVFAIVTWIGIDLYAYNYDLELNGIYYTIDAFGRTAKVVAYPNASGDVIIPDTIVYNSQNLKVIEIGANAFERNEKITSISCRDAKTIGEKAFKGCSNLRSIKIPCFFDSRIPDEIFYECTNLECIDSIAGNYSDIGKSAFYGCSNLNKLIIPQSVTHTSSNAFGGRFHAKKVIIEDGESKLSIFAANVSVNTLLTADTICWYRKKTDFIEYRNSGNIYVGVLIIGNKVEDLPVCFSVSSKVYSLLFTPTPIAIHFTTSTYMDIPLFVPTGSLEQYQNKSGWWSGFFDIKEEDYVSRINSIQTDMNDEIRYNIRGEKLNGVYKGLNIIRYSNGESRKVIVK